MRLSSVLPWGKTYKPSLDLVLSTGGSCLCWVWNESTLLTYEWGEIITRCSKHTGLDGNLTTAPTPRKSICFIQIFYLWKWKSSFAHQNPHITMSTYIHQFHSYCPFLSIITTRCPWVTTINTIYPWSPPRNPISGYIVPLFHPLFGRE